jgi:DNA polymerase III subunit epsilon
MMSQLAELLHLERPLVDLDLETTGIFPNRDRIVQVGLIKFYPDGTVNEWQTLVNPGVLIDPEASAVHKISDDMVRDAPTFCSIASKLFAGLQDCDFMGYNLKVFDIPFLQAEFGRCNLVLKEPRVIDVFKLYQRLSPRNLTAAVKEFLGETFDTAHDALSDTRMAARVLEAMLVKHLDIPRDVSGIHDLLFKSTSGLDAAGKFAWKGTEAVVNFGAKFNGTPLRNAAHCTCRGRCQCLRGYLEWMVRSDFADDTKAIARGALQGTFPTKG